MENKQIFDLADKLKALKDEKKDLDSRTKEVNAEIEKTDLTLSDAMAESEVEKFTRNGSTFYLNTRLYASPIAGKKEELFAALKEKGYGSIVTETVNVNTLARFVKEQMAENNDEIPAWLTEKISTYEKVSVGVRKG